MSGSTHFALLRYLDHRHRTLDPLTICRHEYIRIFRVPMLENVRSVLIDTGRGKTMYVDDTLCSSESLAAIWHEIGHHSFPPAPGDVGDNDANAFAAAAFLKQSVVVAHMCGRCKECGVANPTRELL